MTVKGVRVVVAVPSEWLAALDAAAERRGWSREDYLRRALERALQGEKLKSEEQVQAGKREVTPRFKRPPEPQKRGGRPR